MKDRTKLTVAHVIGSLGIGGAENQVVKLLNGFDPKIIRPVLITLVNRDTAFLRAVAPWVDKVIVPLARHGQISCIRRLNRFFVENIIDIVQSHMFHTNLYVAIAGRLAKVPVVLTTDHGLDPWKKSYHHWIERHIVSPLADIRVVVSQDIVENRLRNGDIPPHKIKLMRNCVSVPLASMQKVRGPVLRIGSVGRLVSLKDYGTLLQAFKLLLNMGISCELTLVGDGPELPTLRAESRDLGIESKVWFAGMQAEVATFLEEFDVFVLSSISEGIPVALLEAMSMGLPVVATSVGGIPEVIEDKMNGMLVPARDPAAMAAAIRCLAEDEALRSRLGKAGHDKVRECYSCETACRRYEKLYLEFWEKKRMII